MCWIILGLVLLYYNGLCFRCVLIQEVSFSFGIGMVSLFYGINGLILFMIVIFSNVVSCVLLFSLGCVLSGKC